MNQSFKANKTWLPIYFKEEDNKYKCIFIGPSNQIDKLTYGLNYDSLKVLKFIYPWYVG
jgi:hypothetical protein